MTTLNQKSGNLCLIKNSVLKRILIFILNVFIFLMIFSTQGILLYFILRIFHLESLKSSFFTFSTTSIALLGSIYYALFTKRQANIIYFLIIIYMILVTTVYSYRLNNIFVIVYSLRQNWALFVLFFIFLVLGKNINYKLIAKLFIFLSIVDLIGAMLFFLMGYQEFLKFFTGNIFYGHNTDLGFKISQISSFWRTPSFVGDSAQYGMLNFMFYVFLDNTKYSKYKIMPLLNVILSLTRSVYIGIFLYILISYLIRKSKKSSIKDIIFFCVLIIISILLVVSFFNGSNNIKIFQAISSNKSTVERFNYWNQILVYMTNNTSYAQMLIGPYFGIAGTSYFYTSNIGAIPSAISVVDNAWLFLLSSIGIIGLILVFTTFIKVSFENPFAFALVISISVSMVFVNLFEGIAFLGTFPVVLSYLVNNMNE